MTSVTVYTITLISGTKIVINYEDGKCPECPISIYNRAMASKCDLTRTGLTLSDHLGPNLVINMAQIAAISRTRETLK